VLEQISGDYHNFELDNSRDPTTSRYTPFWDHSVAANWRNPLYFGQGSAGPRHGPRVSDINHLILFVATLIVCSFSVLVPKQPTRFLDSQK